MGLTQEDVLHILRIMDESDFERLHLELGDLKIDVSKRRNPAALQLEDSLSVSTQADLLETSKKVSGKIYPEKSLRESSGSDEETFASEGLIPVRSPALGIFYTSPRPGDPPFVKPGQIVDRKTTVCIIEVMKLFSTIYAGVRGTVSKVCAKNGQMVEYNQVLFLVEPLSDPEER